MSDFIVKLLSGSLRRVLAVVLGGAIIAMNQKFGLGLDATQIVSIVALVIAYIVQSAIRQGRDLKPSGIPAFIQEAIEKAIKEQAPSLPK